MHRRSFIGYLIGGLTSLCGMGHLKASLPTTLPIVEFGENGDITNYQEILFDVPYVKNCNNSNNYYYERIRKVFVQETSPVFICNYSKFNYEDSKIGYGEMELYEYTDHPTPVELCNLHGGCILKLRETKNTVYKKLYKHYKSHYFTEEEMRELATTLFQENHNAS